MSGVELALRAAVAWVWDALTVAWAWVLGLIEHFLGPDPLYHAASAVMAWVWSWVVWALPVSVAAKIEDLIAIFSQPWWADVTWIASYFVGIFVDPTLVATMIVATLVLWPVYAAVRVGIWVAGWAWSSPASG